MPISSYSKTMFSGKATSANGTTLCYQLANASFNKPVIQLTHDNGLIIPSRDVTEINGVREVEVPFKLERDAKEPENISDESMEALKRFAASTIANIENIETVAQSYGFDDENSYHEAAVGIFRDEFDIFVGTAISSAIADNGLEEPGAFEQQVFFILAVNAGKGNLIEEIAESEIPLRWRDLFDFDGLVEFLTGEVLSELQYDGYDLPYNEVEEAIRFTYGGNNVDNISFWRDNIADPSLLAQQIEADKQEKY